MPLDPAGEAFPLGQQRFVRDLDRRGAGHRIAVEREQPVAGEALQHGGQHHRVDVELGELRHGNSPPRIPGPLAEAHHAEQDLHGDLLLVGVERAVGLLGPSGEDRAQAAERAVVGGGEAGPGHLVALLRQGVLQQRERSGLTHGVGDELGHQRWLDCEPHPLGWSDDRRLELRTRHREDVHHARDEHLGELAVRERPVVEVSPQGEHDRDPAVRLLDGRRECVQEDQASRFVGREEEFLELVEHQDQSAVASRDRQLGTVRTRVLPAEVADPEGSSRLQIAARTSSSGCAPGTTRTDHRSFQSHPSRRPDRRQDAGRRHAGLP